MNAYNYICGTLVVALSALCGVLFLNPSQSENFKYEMKAAYHVVWLENGQTYIGKLQGNLNQQFVVLEDVHYVQNQIDEKSKKTDMILVKREKKEMWKPQYMIISTKRIMYIEAVNPDSLIANSIKNMK